MKPLIVLTLSTCILTACHTPPAETTDKPEGPNVLLISIDDLNDWVGYLAGHPQAQTPNVDRLASQGIAFTNAHCPSPSCNPCRAAVLSGKAPWNTGIYANDLDWRDVLLPETTTLPTLFRENGWDTRGGGKIFHHYQNDPHAWDSYFPSINNAFPEGSHAPAELDVPFSFENSTPYREFTWGSYQAEHDSNRDGDQATVNHVIGLIENANPDVPFFYNCGIYRPHLPWYVPQKYFDQFPLEDIQLPIAPADDIDDLPEGGRRFAGNDPYFQALTANNQRAETVQAYLASVAYMDDMVGQLMDALDNSPHANNTIVVLWSDHGFHLGEKQWYRKFTLWEDSTHVPFIIRMPKQHATQWGNGQTCHEAVSTQDIYPTLAALANLQADHELDGESLVPLLQDPTTARETPAITAGDWGSAYSIRTENWTYIRYVHYEGEELYNRHDDPHQLNNLAIDPAYRAIMDELGTWVPENPKPFIPPNYQANADPEKE